MKKLIPIIGLGASLFVLTGCSGGESQYVVGDDYIYLQKKSGLYVSECTMTSPTNITIPSSYKDITVVGLNLNLFAGGEKLKGTPSLESVVIPDSVKYIGDFCFYGCDNLKTVNIPTSLEKVSDSSFCFTKIESAILPEGLTKIEMYGFAHCYELKTVYLPSTIKYIQAGAFRANDKLSAVYYNGTKEDFKHVKVTNISNQSIGDNNIYYYSETKPSETGKYWHYVDGSYTAW